MLKEILSSEIVKAAKSGDKNRVMALKMVKSKYQEWATAKGTNGRTINDLEVSQEVSIIRKLAEDYDLDASQYKNREDANSKDTYTTYLDISRILREYLPKEVSPDEIKKAISESGIELIKPNMGKLINYIKNTLPGSDGKIVSDVVKSLL